VVVLDGERREVEIDLTRPSVRMGSHEWPIQLGPAVDGAVSFEILGERVEARREPRPSGPSAEAVVINGELHQLVVESITGGGAPVPGPRSGAAAAAPTSPSGPVEEGGSGRAIFPPMPGKVLEVRVRNGEKVEPGQVLLVVEAMKMRNEVTSPVAGEVAGLRAKPGMNVSARETLLRVVAP
jgi:glutaconyl-CoA/methylmalonyl-CoA decarboxylase subunit gamma